MFFTTQNHQRVKPDLPPVTFWFLISLAAHFHYAKAMSILIIKAEIEDLPKPTWRRLAVPATATIDQLHAALQEAFQWNDYHLHEFMNSRGERYGLPNPEEELLSPDVPPMLPEPMFEVTALFDSVPDTARYIYDYGDYWVHNLTLEAIVEGASLEFPQIVAFQGPSLPEDSGGVAGYLEKVNILSKPKSPLFRETSEWLEAVTPPVLNVPLANAKTRSKIQLLQKIAEIAPLLDEEEN